MELKDLPKVFTGNQYCFQGLVRPSNIDEANNILYVDLTNENGSEWSEEWDLGHTITGLKQGEYFEIAEPIINEEKDLTDGLTFDELLFPYNVRDMDDFEKNILPPLTKKQWTDKVEAVTPSDPIGRNDLCPCGSGKKYKKCCL